jgi:hypothetical protein
MADHPVFDRGDLLIHTKDRTLEDEIFEDSDSVNPGGEVTLRNNGTYIKKDAISPSTVMVLVDFGRDVGTGIAAAWLYDKLKDKEVSIETTKGTYEKTKDGIQQALEDIAEEKDDEE